MTIRCVFCDAVPTKDVLCCEPYRAVRMLEPRGGGALTDKQASWFTNLVRAQSMLHDGAVIVPRSWPVITRAAL